MLALLPYLKWLHILSAIVAVGANVTYLVWMRAAEKDKSATAFALKGIARLEKLANPAYGLLFLSGIAMLFVGSIPWTTPWVLSGIILFVVIAALGGAGYSPALRKQTQLADKPDSAEYRAAEERANRIGIAIILLASVVEFLMTVKPALWG